MPDSYTSRPVHVFDSPEVKKVTVDFKYNFFTPDERIDESGIEQIDGTLPISLKRDGKPDLSNLTARVPRFVTLRLEYLDSKKMMKDKTTQGIPSATKDELIDAIANNKVVTETNATSRIYNAFTLGNFSIDDELENLMRVSLNKYIASGQSPSTAVNQLGMETDVSTNQLSMMLPPELNDISTLSKKYKKISSKIEGMSKVSSQIQLNTVFAPMILRRSVERGTSLLDGSINSNFSVARGIVGSEKKLGRLPNLTDDDLEFEIPFFRNPKALPYDKKISASSAVVGVLVEKKRVFKGKKYVMPSIVVAGLRPETVWDTKVAYGQTYEYTVRTLSVFRIPVVTTEGDRLLATYLIASKESEPVQVRITEDRIPQPPSDIDFFYDYENGGLNIFWRPPVNPQRDVKYYQVFRRRTLQEPFELLCMIDFDDSAVRSMPKEMIDPSLVRPSAIPKYTFFDSEFTKDSSFIYAVVSVDARQLSSAYSTQVMVHFDQTKNRIKKELICRQGAPKQYPNWTKKENFFVDSMKDSSHSNVRIYFDPEAYTIINKSGEKQPLFIAKSNDRLAKYIFQFINTDRLAEQRFEIKIDDVAYRDDPNNEWDTIMKDPPVDKKFGQFASRDAQKRKKKKKKGKKYKSK